MTTQYKTPIDWTAPMTDIDWGWELCRSISALQACTNVKWEAGMRDARQIVEDVERDIEKAGIELTGELRELAYSGDMLAFRIHYDF